jgi:hypothetical protein
MPPLLQPLHHLLPQRPSSPPAAAAVLLQVARQPVKQLLLLLSLRLQPVQACNSCWQFIFGQ